MLLDSSSFFRTQLVSSDLALVRTRGGLFPLVEVHVPRGRRYRDVDLGGDLVSTVLCSFLLQSIFFWQCVAEGLGGRDVGVREQSKGYRSGASVGGMKYRLTLPG